MKNSWMRKGEVYGQFYHDMFSHLLPCIVCLMLVVGKFISVSRQTWVQEGSVVTEKISVNHPDQQPKRSEI